MIQTRTIQALSLLSAALLLTACGAPHYNQPVTDNGQNVLTSTQPTYYRGTASGVAAASTEDEMINANVLSAVSMVPGLHESNIQVSTLRGAVSLSGTVDSRATAQSVVQAARQVQGVRSVTYDLLIR